MFDTPNVWMVFKAGKLTTAKVDDVERRMAECQFVIDPLRPDLAEELGDAVETHLFDGGGAVRPELTSITLDPRVPMQRLLARAGQGIEPTRIDDVEILSMAFARQVDEKTGDEWIKATIRVRFDFAPTRHREWIAMYFGLGFEASFEAQQGDMFDESLDAADRLQRLVDENDGSITVSNTDTGEELLRVDPKKGRRTQKEREARP